MVQMLLQVLNQQAQALMQAQALVPVLALAQDVQKGHSAQHAPHFPHLQAQAPRNLLHHMGNLSERDYLAYRKLFELVVGSLPLPNLLVYLRCPAVKLMERIRKRARNIETGITVEYLSLLESFYDEWLLSFDLCPVLTIPTDDLDFVHQPMALEIVVERIQEKLGGREEIDFGQS